MLSRIGLILGYVCVIFVILLFLSKDRRTISILKITYELLFSLSYVLQSLYTIAGLCVLAAFRQVVFYNRDKGDWAKSKLWLVFFLLCTPLSFIINNTLNSWENVGSALFIDLLPVIGSYFYVFAFYAIDVLKSKLLCVPAVIVYLLYAILIKNVPSMITTSISIVSLIVGIIIYFKALRKRDDGLQKGTNV